MGLWGTGVTQVPSRRAGRSGPRPGDRVYRMMVAAQSVGWLRHLLDDPASLIQVTRVTVVVDSWTIPQGGWSGRLGPLSHMFFHRIRQPRNGEGRVLVDIGLHWPTPLRTVVTAVLPLLTPVRPMPRSASADVTAQDVFPAWMGVGPNDTAVSGGLPGRDDVRPYDVVLTATGEGPLAPDLPAEADRAPVTEAGGAPVTGGAPATPTAGYRTILAASGAGAGAAPLPEAVLVDLEHAVVRDRYGPFGPSAARAQLTFTGAADGRGWQIAGAEGLLCGGRVDRPWLSEQERDALAGIAVLDCPAIPAQYPLEEAALLVHLVLAGVLVHAPDLPPACAAHLADEVRFLISAPLPDRRDELEWEVRAVGQRRAAMRQHATGFGLPRLTAAAFPALSELPSVSALLVTKRLEHVVEALAGIEAQTYPNLELVLCLHGVELPPQLRARVVASGRPVEFLTLPRAYGFGEAAGRATARARGSLVTKFDDDDTYGPEHIWDLVLARYHSGATMVGKGAEFVHLQSLNTTVRRDAGPPETFTPVVAGGTMLISRGDLEQVGGWRPVPRSIDRGLMDRVHRAGGMIYRTHPLGYVYHRRSDGHTWDPGLEYFLRGGGRQWSGLPRHPEFGTAGPGVPCDTARTDDPAAPANLGVLRPSVSRSGRAAATGIPGGAVARTF
jgi:hypothetical protein